MIVFKTKLWVSDVWRMLQTFNVTFFSCLVTTRLTVSSSDFSIHTVSWFCSRSTTTRCAIDWIYILEVYSKWQYDFSLWCLRFLVTCHIVSVSFLFTLPAFGPGWPVGPKWQRKLTWLCITSFLHYSIIIWTKFSISNTISWSHGHSSAASGSARCPICPGPPDFWFWKSKKLIFWNQI